MVTKSNDIRVIKTKKLIRGGLTQLAKQKSINKITVKELTDLIDINRGTFYLHYKDVYDLVTAIEDELYREFEEIISSVSVQSVKENPLAILERLCSFIQGNAGVCGVLIGENGDPAFASRFGDPLNDKILALFWELVPDMDRAVYDLSYEYCKYGVTGLIRCWLVEHPEWSTDRIARLWFKLICDGLLGIVKTDRKAFYNDISFG